MRRRELSNGELEQVKRLRHAGSSWLKIQHETKIDRRTAKRAYERWERSKSVEELKEARKDVAAQLFREHMESLVRIAEGLVMYLGVPTSLTHMERNSGQFFSWLWEQDLLERSPTISIEDREVYPPPSGQRVVNPESYRREKQLLFESLKTHTSEEIRWEDVLDNRWRKARDNCAEIVRKLPKETSEVVNNFLNQERETNFLQRVKEGSGEDDPAKQMVEVMLRAIWRAIRQDKLDEEGPWVQTIPRGKGPAQQIELIGKSRSEKVLSFIGDTNKSLAEKVSRTCNLAYNNLRKGDMVHQLRDEVRYMEKATEELREMLNPVKLTPMILRTRCDLCPA